MHADFGTALLLTTAAGLATGLGSLLGIAVRPGPRFMSASLGFAAGIMIMISSAELLPDAVRIVGFLEAHLAFFAGMLLMLAIDFSIPHIYMAEDHEPHRHRHGRNRQMGELQRTSLLVALGIGIHNFPEGMATMAGSLADVKIGVVMAVAIAMHNIPEGLAVSVPIFAATGSRRKAFLYSLGSGIAEPIGAGIGGFALHPILTPANLARILAAIAGVMIYVSLDELVPASRKYGEPHTAILAAIVGMGVVVASLAALR